MNRIITVAAPKPPEQPAPPTDAERRKRALEQLRRNLLSAAKQVDHLLEMDARREREDQAA
jgi:hypothetical protein